MSRGVGICRVMWEGEGWRSKVLTLGLFKTDGVYIIKGWAGCWAMG